MSTSTRIARINDVEYITELSCQLGYETTREKTRQRLTEILNHTDNCVFVAVNDAKVIGWIHGFYSLRVESESFVEIGGLVVDKIYQKKGIGKLLI
ncbi:MAG: GNAT family N-acetyltransferase, partial [Bacteroidetes bacterium]|nr:GNAT family N-acetyltransferase [Bacteroidota bacterium]